MFAGAAVFAATAVGQAPRYRGPLETEAPKPQLALPGAPPAFTPDATVVEYPIVRVNDRIIDNSDYQRAQEQLLSEAHENNEAPEELAQRQKDLLRDMIDQQLLLSRGKDLDVNADAEVIRELDAIRKQNKLDSMDALQNAVRQSGVSYEDFTANIKNKVITQEVVRDEVGRTLRMTNKEEQAYYDAHKKDFEQPEQVRLSEILVPTPDNATDAQLAQAQAKASDAAAQLKAGAKFEDLAKQYSGGPNPDTGGDLGEFKRGQLAKVLEDQTFSLKPGETTAPIRTRQGFVVLKVAEHTPGGAQPLSEVEPQVQQAIYDQAIQPALRTYLTGLREKAYIDIAPGYVDTGASPNQTKALYAAYAPPAVKAKVEQKARMDQTHGAATGAKASNGGAGAVAATGMAGTEAAATSAAATSATGTSAMGAAASGTAGSGATAAKTVKVTSNKKPKKIKREKVRYGLAPRNSLPASPEETVIAESGEGPGAPASGEAPGAAVGTSEEASLGSTGDPLAPAADRKKTRFSDRAVEEKTAKAATKSAKGAEKAAAMPVTPAPEESALKQLQDAPLGLGGDTATKKKKQKVKGADKERIQEKAPTAPAAKPEMTPIPPKSVRDNGEPVVAPPSDTTTLPPATAPAPGAMVDTQPSTPANPAPAPRP